MKISKCTSFDELPVVMRVPQVAEVLGIGREHAYDIARTEDFPAITVGNRIIVSRDKFLVWLEEKFNEAVTTTDKPVIKAEKK